MVIKMTLTYDGTAYSGWQIQPDSITVQQRVEEALYTLTGEKINVTASGRTDAGVHAKGQVISFETNSTIPPENFYKALNIHLPNDVKAVSSERAEDGFNARRNAKRKTYTYTLYHSDAILPLIDRYAEIVYKKLDVKKLEKCAKVFIGEHDFKCFCKSDSEVNSTVRTVYDITVKEEDGVYKIDFTGSGFLYNMVRTMVGTLLKMEKGELSIEQAEEMLKTGDRTKVGKTYSAKGLTLKSVEYTR